MAWAFLSAGIRLGFAMLLLAGFVAPAGAGRLVALVIGNGNYVHAPKLDTPANDAKLIAATLQGLGFTLIGGGPLIDLDRPSFELMMRDFGRAIEPGTVALFYYSGLGLQVHGSNYLVPVLANLTSVTDVDFELINLDVVVRQMDAAHSGLNLVILDTCRANPFEGRGLPAGVGGLAAMRPPDGTVIAFAAQPGQAAREGGFGGDSPYAEALAKALKLPGIDAVKALTEAGRQVSQASGGSQVPWLSTAPAGPSEPVVKAEPPEAAPTMVIYPPASPPPVVPAPAPPPAPAPAVIGADEISEAQRLVLAMGISRGTVTGRADARLAEALRIFQRATKQPETGVLTMAGLEALRLPPPDARVRAAAVFGFAGEAARAGRSGDATALYQEGLRLDPGNAAAQHALAELHKPPPVRPVVQRPPPPPPEPAPSRAGFSATAANLRGQQFRAGAASEAAAIAAALASCRAVSWECRIVGK